MLIYQNPIINADYSDPDAIRVENDFFMLSSSFNHTPGIPVLHSKNLVDWEIINYVYEKIPFERFKDVCHGHGAWAPAIRYYNKTYYAIIPFPDEGIYIGSTKDPYAKWSDLWCLLPGKGIIDPCPIWTKDKCYLVTGFAKSRIGFNSVLGLYEVSQDLKTKTTDYKIIYDGHNDNPTVEGPKFNERNGYYYIMAPAGSVKSGWQLCLRSKEIYGPYETKIVLMQNGSAINGPHQGALIEIDDNDHWAFLHFQDKDCYGRVVHLQPVTWINDWPILGEVTDPLLSGTPCERYEYVLPLESSYIIPTCDEFKNEQLSLVWQTPANKQEGFFILDNGLKLNCFYHSQVAYECLNETPNLFLQKLMYRSFKIKTKAFLCFSDGDETGLCIMGNEYAYICVANKNNQNYLQIKKGYFQTTGDEVLFEEEYHGQEIVFNLKFIEPNSYQLGFNGHLLRYKFKSYPGKWIGTKVGIYAKGFENSMGYAKYDYFIMKEIKL